CYTKLKSMICQILGSLRSKIKFTGTFCLILFCIKNAFAEDIYRWEDESGVIHFTSKPDNPKAKKAELPEIMRARMGTEKSSLATCDSHGGINCQAGPDKDGSVICLDGFSEATARFKFRCSTARLKLAQVKFDDKADTLRVYVRNQQGIQADAVEVYYMQGGRERKDFMGPPAVKAYGVAEYTLKISTDDLKADPDYKTRVYLRCMNCS
ncbi:MAG: DUF4124 domain-containing protein, partial [Bdellovibrionales bacterium]|nr:DUF4124 domain-containing protein [Bdellovibrionales bacterium]